MNKPKCKHCTIDENINKPVVEFCEKCERFRVEYNLEENEDKAIEFLNKIKKRKEK